MSTYCQIWIIIGMLMPFGMLLRGWSKARIEFTKDHTTEEQKRYLISAERWVERNFNVNYTEKDFLKG